MTFKSKVLDFGHFELKRFFGVFEIFRLKRERGGQTFVNLRLGSNKRRRKKKIGIKKKQK